MRVPGTAILMRLQVLERQRLAGDDHGAVALAHAAAAAHQRVVLLQVRVGVEADGGYVEEGLALGAEVEGLDVAQRVREPVAGDADLVGGQAIEHKGVIGVGTVGDGDVEHLGRAGGSGFLVAHGEQRSFQRKTTISLFLRRFPQPVRRPNRGLVRRPLKAWTGFGAGAKYATLRRRLQSAAPRAKRAGQSVTSASEQSRLRIPDQPVIAAGHHGRRRLSCSQSR